MKKTDKSKKKVSNKSIEKLSDSDELRKPAKLKPLKTKEKKNWKNNLDDEEEGFEIEDDIKLETDFDEDENEDFYDDENY